MRRKILMGALALALPAGMLAVSQTAAVAAPAANPIACTGFAAVVTFAGPLTNEGVATANNTGGDTTVAPSSFNCGGGHLNGANSELSITGGKNAKLAKTDARYNKTTGVKYVEDTWDSFAASGTGLKKTLKNVTFTINGHTDTVKVKSSNEIIGGPGTPCASKEVGFQINGQDKGFYYDKTATIVVCLKGDTRNDHSSGIFGNDLFTDTGGGVVSAQINGADSTATI